MGRLLIAYDGPPEWVAEWEHQPVPSVPELLTSIEEIDLGAPDGDDYVIDRDLVETLCASIAALTTELQRVEEGHPTIERPLVVDVHRVFRAGGSWF